MEKFEEYFQRADVDRDGRISGAEAVSFLLGSNLPRPVLAQIWNHVDQNRSGFLSRPEFYNALKLVTVAQSKRDLTPNIVKAALYGPSSSKIPPPQISTAAMPVQPNSVATSSFPQTAVTPQPSQNFGFRGSAPSNTSVNQQVGVLPSSTGMRPVGSMPSGQSPHYGLAPSTSGINQHLAQAQPSSIMNQQFGLVQHTNMMMNHHFRQLQLQPSSTGINQQFRPPSSTTNMNQQFFPMQGSQTMRPSQSMHTLNASRPPQATGSSNISRNIVGSSVPYVSNELLGGNTGAASTGQVTQGLDKGARWSSMPVVSNPQDLLSTFSSSAANDNRGLVRSASDPMFAGGSFSVYQSSPPQVSPVSQSITSSLPTSSVVSPVTSSSQSSEKADPFEALQSTLMKPSSGIQASQTPSLPKSQQTPNQVNSSALSSSVQASVGNLTSEQSQTPWPKMTRAGIQKYAKVFMEVDSDRDGKINGDQARNLFLSWRLPREVLKQVWDLADQDSDSMLSLREFCIALYLMERYREGCSLPPTLPNSVMLDETLLSLAGPPSTYGSMGWATATGLRPQQALPGAQPIAPASGRPPMQPVVSQSDAFMQFNQKNARGPLVDNSQANQPSNGESYSMGLEAEETNEKVDDKENVILDSREKLEFYRTKMQDLVLYKSRCDNRLNEITERAKADKTEAELLEKKYQEKYKQVAEIHSKLTIEEATFREIQERKTELQQAITKMEQGGSADGILEVRADRIQSDLEELLKALTERCKKHSMEIQSSSLIEIPTGWQPGIPEVAAVWDEDWDKFEDEGFSFDTVVPAVETKSDLNENSSPTHSPSPDSVTNAALSDKLFGLGAFDTESLNSAYGSRSPHGSPERQTIPETPSQEHSENHFRKSSDGDTETHRSFDDSTWGNFDNNDDVDSIWGFNAKDLDQGKHDEKYFFRSTDLGASPQQRGSPHADSAFQKSSPFTFEDSVPGSPISRAGHSPTYSVDSRDPFFDNFSRFDSFRTNDAGSSSRTEGLTRFDSTNSTRGFNHSSNYSFDDSDPFGSSGPFKVSSETSNKDSESRSAF